MSRFRFLLFLCCALSDDAVVVLLPCAASLLIPLSLADSVLCPCVSLDVPANATVVERRRYLRLEARGAGPWQSVQ